MLLSPDTLLDLSTALRVKLYAVSGVRPDNAKVVEIPVDVANKVPLLYIRYSEIDVSSVGAIHARFTLTGVI